MSWIQENKFVAGLIGVTAVLGGGILYFGNSQGNAYNEKMEKYETLKGQYATLEKSKPYPNSANKKAKEEAMAAYRESISEVRKGLTAYRPEKLERMTPEQFSDLRVDASKKMRKMFEDIGTTLPEETQFGFEKYANSAVKSAATPKLNYQLEATQWLLTRLAEVKPSALVNIVRKPLPIETGKAAPAQNNAPVRKKGAKRKGGKNKGGARPVAASGPYELMSMELTFTAREDGVREFLKDMVSSEKYFFAIRSVRVRNEKQTPPTEKDANFPAAPAVPDPFSGFPGLGDAPEGDATTDDTATPAAGDGAAAVPEPAAPVAPVAGNGDRVLKQVLGDEKLDVHIVFDIVLLKSVKAAAPNSGKGAGAK